SLDFSFSPSYMRRPPTSTLFPTRRSSDLYEHGELKAIAYDENGVVIATDVRRSFGDAERIRLKADKEKLVANGTDLLFIEISMEDKAGNQVENANNRVHVNVTGVGRLVGLDNGDSTDFDQYKGTSRRLFSGKLMAIVASTFESGNVQIEVTSEGLESEKREFVVLPAEEEIMEGISASTKNIETPIVMGEMEKEIPLRKLEIISDTGQNFHPELKEDRKSTRLNSSHVKIS